MPGQTNAGPLRQAQLWLAAPACGIVAGRDGGSRKARRALERNASRALLAETGAPQMPQRSLSHSGGCAAIAIAPAGCRAGVDIETATPRDVRSIARFAFSPDEARELRALALPAAIARFYVMWTLKEAFAKALGMPLLAALRECAFTFRDSCWAGRIPTAEPWRATVFKPRPLLTLAAVVVGPCDTPRDDWACWEWPVLAEPSWLCLTAFVADNRRDQPQAADRPAAESRIKTI
ncbi:MAG: 4'-phosphopantetheinyl transferase superfamily protein [Steroidobacteraceae bacterium]